MGIVGLVTRADVDKALRRVEAGESGVEDANLLRGYICGLEVGMSRCVYCGMLVSGAEIEVRRHVEKDCPRHYARQLEERLGIYEDGLV